MQYFDKTYKFITDAKKGGGKVLIHCYKGISRSSTVVIAYVMRSAKFTYKKAFELVKKKHQQTDPDVDFRRQLI